MPDPHPKVRSQPKSLHEPVQSQLALAAGRLQGLLGEATWNALHKHTRSCLVTSEVLNYLLESINSERERKERKEGTAGEAPEIDFSPIVLSLFKGIETEIEQNLLRPFRDAYTAPSPPVSSKPGSASVDPDLLAYLTRQGRPPSLGRLAVILSRLGSANGENAEAMRDLKRWMKQRFVEPERWWQRRGLGLRMDSRVLKDRNDAAHTERFTPQQAMQSYRRLWGRPGSEGLVPAVFRALERRPSDGERIGKYQIRRAAFLKNRHWMLEVHDEHMDRDCLVSLIPGAFDALKSLSPDFRSRSELRHPALLTLQEWFPAPDRLAGRVAVVSELRGHAIIRHRKMWAALNEHQCREVALALADAVSTLHSNGFIHGFISPHLVLRDAGGNWILTGQALALLANGGLRVYSYPRTTAPECASDDCKRTGKAADVFAIAATVCCLRQRLVIRNAVPPSPQEAEALFEEPGLRSALARALHADPRERLTAADLLHALKGESPPPAATLESLSAVQSRIQNGRFDVFLCYNREDAEEVRGIAQQLKERGIAPWLDEWQLPPGEPWRKNLERSIAAIGAAAVFVGKRGVGPWQKHEIEALLNKMAERKSRIIPVILSSARRKPRLPLFLSAFNWVDFQKPDPDPMNQLIWGITGRTPGAR